MSGNCVDMSGNCVDMSGNCVDVSGNCVDVSGNCVDVSGNCVDVSGNCLDFTDYFIPFGEFDKTIIQCEQFIPKLFDNCGQGTHECGIIASDNSNKIIGMAPECNLFVSNPLHKNNLCSFIIEILSSKWLLETVKPIVTCHCYQTKSYSHTMDYVFNLLNTLGITCICSSGNDNNDNDIKPIYPGNFIHDNIINVSSIDSDYKISNFSNYGSNSVDVVAPGSSIFSLYTKNNINQQPYAILSSTTLASCYVTGAYILLWEILFSNSLTNRDKMKYAINKLLNMTVNKLTYQNSSKPVKYGSINVSKYLDFTEHTIFGNMYLTRKKQIEFNKKIN